MLQHDIVCGPRPFAVCLHQFKLSLSGPRANGLALALPEQVAMARPTGFGHALTTRIPIEGRDEWLAAAGVKSA